MSFLNLFRKPSAVKIANDQLEESQRMALAHHSAANHHAKMAEYHDSEIKRLQKYVAQHTS